MAARNGPDTQGAGDLSLAQIAEQYLADLETRAKRGTVLASKHSLGRLVAELDACTAPAVHAWRLKRIGEGAAHKTVNNDVSALKAALSLAVQLGQLPAHPLAGLKALPVTARHQRRRPRALTDDELRALLHAAEEADREPCSFPREPFVRALVLTGCRYAELALATWGDLDSAHGLITLRSENVKTEAERTIPLERDLLQAIEGLRWAHERLTGKIPDATTRIFLAPEGRPWGTRSAVFLRQLKILFRRAGIPLRDQLGRVAHVGCLRHSFVTRLARAGVPIATAQILTGHKSASVLLNVYTHLHPSDVRNVVEGLPSLVPSGNLKRDRPGGSPRSADALEQFAPDGRPRFRLVPGDPQSQA